ncbi:MAG: GSU2403 family nucleotidyltransferase fold protein, partial [Acidiferrobacterales bacterium]
MKHRRYSIQLQAVYSELIEQLQVVEIEGLMEKEGSFVRRLRRNDKPFWYFRRRVGERIHERYIGPETPELVELIEKLKNQVQEAKDAAKQRRSLIRQLQSAGYLMTDRRTGRVLEELARAGVFRLNGVLVGTHAFRCYPALLGVQFVQQLALTSDVDIAQDTSVSLGITDAADPQLGEALAKAEKFIEIPALNPTNPSTSWRTTDQELRVDVLTSLVGKSGKGTLEVPTLGAHAKALRFLDFL